MFTQDFSLKLKSLDDEGSFTGYASTYGGPPDLVGDIIEPGAFAQSIAEQGKGYPLLWSHRTDEPIGLVKVTAEGDSSSRNFAGGDSSEQAGAGQGVKSLPDVVTMLRGLRDASEPEVLAQLRSINGELKRLLQRKDSNCRCGCAECQASDCADCSDPDCEDTNCEGNMAALEALSALKRFATSLKSMAA